VCVCVCLHMETNDVVDVRHCDRYMFRAETRCHRQKIPY
jgi:hypothetical protein